VRFLGFIGTILLLTALCWAMVGSIMAEFIPGGVRTVGVIWVLSVVPIFVLIRNLATGHYPSAVVRLLLFRVFWYAQLLMLALTIAAFAGFLAGTAFGAPLTGSRIAIMLTAPALVLLALWGYAGTRRLVVNNLTLHPRGMPAALDGLRIAQLSDLHVGPQTSRSMLQRILAATREAGAHIIAFTGDQVDDHPRDAEVFAATFGTLQAPLGVYSIPGNHDVYAGWAAVRRGLESAGTTVLVNRSVELRHNGARFWLAGTGDPAGGQFSRGPESGAPDIERTLANVPSDGFCIALAHNPALFPALARRGVAVTLSGHTHHGQFSIPSRGWSLASVFLEFAMGTYERNGSLLYISPGTNFWGIPFRIGALPEVTVITLKTNHVGEARGPGVL
jgi:predicted MPP superfamily phosphohydrolase